MSNRTEIPMTLTEYNAATSTIAAADDALTAALVALHGTGYRAETNAQGDVTIYRDEAVVGHVQRRGRHSSPNPYVAYVNVPGSAVSHAIRAFGQSKRYGTYTDAALAIVTEYAAAAKGTPWETDDAAVTAMHAYGLGKASNHDARMLAASRGLPYVSGLDVEPTADVHGDPVLRIATADGVVRIPRSVLSALAEHVTYWDATMDN